jgi:hypothetical protein
VFSCSVVAGRLQLLQCNATSLFAGQRSGQSIANKTEQTTHITTFRLCSVKLNQSQVVIAIIESDLCVSVVVRDLID